MKKKAGFTLIELMIVVTIIAILAALAIPFLMRARINSNEGSAIGSMRTLSSAQANFQAGTEKDGDTDGTGEYGTLDELKDASPFYIDSSLGSGNKSGYIFEITLDADPDVNEIQWEATAYPARKARTGNRTFYVDESGIIRGKDMGGVEGAPGSPAARADAVPEDGGDFPPIGGS